MSSVRQLLLIAAAAAVLFAPADFAASPPASPAEQAASGPVWPKPPAPPRVHYLRSIAGPEDWGIAKGFLQRLMDKVSGRQDLHFVRPTSVVERGGVLFVADPGAQALFIFDAPAHHVLTVNAAGNEALLSPIGLALGPDDKVFLADSGLRKVFTVDREGKVLPFAAGERWMRPVAVAWDAAGSRLYVADSAAHRIGVYGPDGTPLQSFGSNGIRDGEFNSPTHLALAGDGRLFVTDALNYRIQAFDAGGSFVRKMGSHGDGAGDFASPKGVAVDAQGQLYVVDALFNAVQIFDRDGALLLGFGETGTKPGQFSLPGGIFIDGKNTLYVADSFNQRIQLFELLREPER
jgi:DNA-binding beta-propeller fold protein YncE